MRSWIWITVDAAMLVAFIVLQVWRFTGVPLHEWLAIALIAAILAHLAVHWAWVETRTRRIRRPRTARTRVNYAVNAVLFGAMAVAMISGFAISKVVLPLHPAPGDYVRWHGIHELSSRIAIAAVGLHLAMNWSVLFRRRPRIRAWLRPLAWTLVVAATLTAASLAIERVMPQPDIVVITPQRRIEHAAPPADIATLRPDQRAPNVRFAVPLIANAAAVALGALIGRRVLRLRLD